MYLKMRGAVEIAQVHPSPPGLLADCFHCVRLEVDAAGNALFDGNVVVGPMTVVYVGGFGCRHQLLLLPLPLFLLLGSVFVAAVRA